MGNLLNIQTNMDLGKLPEETKLFKLLKKCELEHELELTSCSDGALIMRCYACPFSKVLEEKEETYFRTVKKDL